MLSDGWKGKGKIKLSRHVFRFRFNSTTPSFDEIYWLFQVSCRLYNDEIPQ